MAKIPIKKIRFPSFPSVVKPMGKDSMPTEDDKILTENFDYRSEDELDIICNIFYVLPRDFDQVNEVTEKEDDCFAEEIENHKPLC